MSSSAPRNGERMIHQDFIARIRYSNNLPPPPNPPKLLDIPNTGLTSGQYTKPSFATRLAREQPLNIEADAELGMPLDLVGMPGIFDGDESSIQAPASQPHVHPHDRALLRPLSTLGRPKGTDASVSFLRRTEYISSVGAKRSSSAASSPFIQSKARRPNKRPVPEPDADSPAGIRRKIDKSFEAAQRIIKNPRSVPHPSRKPGVHIVDSHPFIPDLDAFPDSGAYITVKLQNNPVSSASTYDRRLLSAILQPLPKTVEEEEAFQEALLAHELAPNSFPKPLNLLDYNFFIPVTQQVGERFRVSFDIDNSERNAEELYTHSSSRVGPCFQFSRLRSYETTKETEFQPHQKYDEELIVSFNETEGTLGESGEVSRQKAAYFYPVIQRTTIQPQRAKNIARTMTHLDEDSQAVSQLDIIVSDPDESRREMAATYREKPLSSYDGNVYGGADDEDAASRDEEAAATTGGAKNGDAEGRRRVEGDESDAEEERRSRSPPASEGDADGDAEGEDDA